MKIILFDSYPFCIIWDAFRNMRLLYLSVTSIYFRRLSGHLPKALYRAWWLSAVYFRVNMCHISWDLQHRPLRMSTGEEDWLFHTVMCYRYIINMSKRYLSSLCNPSWLYVLVMFNEDATKAAVTAPLQCESVVEVKVMSVTTLYTVNIELLKKLRNQPHFEIIICHMVYLSCNGYDIVKRLSVCTPKTNFVIINQKNKLPIYYDDTLWRTIPESLEKFYKSSNRRIYIAPIF